MTSRRQFEREVWSFFGGYINASSPDELGIYEYDELSKADQARAEAAIERVLTIIQRHVGSLGA